MPLPFQFSSLVSILAKSAPAAGVSVRGYRARGPRRRRPAAVSAEPPPPPHERPRDRPDATRPLAHTCKYQQFINNGHYKHSDASQKLKKKICTIYNVLNFRVTIFQLLTVNPLNYLLFIRIILMMTLTIRFAIAN